MDEKGTFDMEKTQETEIRHSSELKDSWRSLIFRVSFNLFLFIFFFLSDFMCIINSRDYYSLYLVMIFFYERLAELDLDSFQLSLINFCNIQFRCLCVLAGLFYFMLQLRNWIENFRFNLIKLERGNLIKSGIVRTQLRHHKYQEDIGSPGSRVINRKNREVIDL